MSNEMANNRKKKVVFEDDLAFRSSYVSGLESRGFDVAVYTSPQEISLEDLKKNKPDLFSFDIFMPGMTGIEAAKKYLGDDELSQIPFVFISTQEGDIREVAESLGPKKFFSKFKMPISDIVQYIDQLLH